MDKKSRHWIYLAVAAFLVILFWIISKFTIDAAGISAGPKDLAILAWIAQFRTEGLTSAVVDISSLGSFPVITLMGLTVFLFIFQKKDWRGALFLLLILLGAAIWPALLKLIFTRARPDAAHFLVKASGYSFPSGHSFGSSAFYLGLAFLAARHARTRLQEMVIFLFSALVVLLVGLSRMYLGVHYPSDVAAGFAAGAAWAFSLTGIFSYWAAPEKPDSF